ncbi:hypothetical protein GALL_466110 [mine drainage metagenome]|uniref:Uncharacterized protein n=1 Tax=mine drainage metagenome TaxID=410659 RepID=A0A1J5PKV0_9ZZZZ
MESRRSWASAIASGQTSVKGATGKVAATGSGPSSAAMIAAALAGGAMWGDRPKPKRIAAIVGFALIFPLHASTPGAIRRTSNAA